MQTAQILQFPTRAAVQPLPALDDGEIGLALALSICARHNVGFSSFYSLHPEAVSVGDATVNRDVFARFIGLAA